MPFQVILVFYIAFFCVLLYKVPKQKLAGLDNSVLPVLFLLKVVAGIAYGYLHFNSAYGSQTDTWKFYYQSLAETDLLTSNPKAFLNSIFGNGYAEQHHHLAGTTNNYWNDLKHNIMLFFMSVCNLLSGKNYYITVVLYNAVSMVGIIYYIKLCVHYFKKLPSLWIAISLCTPSFLFWASGFHKEGILFTSLALLLWSVHCIYTQHKYLLASIVFAGCLLLILLLRNYYVLFIVPFISIWIVLLQCNSLKYRGRLFAGTFAAIIGMFWLSFYLPQNSNLLYFTAKGHQELAALGGNMAIQQPMLQPYPSSFINFLPHAIRNAFLEPNFQHFSAKYLVFILENIAVAVLLIFTTFKLINTRASTLSYLYIYVAISIFIFIGFTVPNAGAIIRYKAVLMPLLWVVFGQYFIAERNKLHLL
jgi:hypothetical protein